MLSAQDWLAKIHALPLQRKVRIMNVCGGHERSISIAGLRSALPQNIELIAGPGCPVCVCPEEDVYQAIQLALHARVILGGVWRHAARAVNVPRNPLPIPLPHAGVGGASLASGVKVFTRAPYAGTGQAAGADVRPIASPREAVKIARENPGREVVFFAAGFETTTAPVAAMLLEGVPDNLLLLLSGRLTWPAVAMLLDRPARLRCAGCPRPCCNSDGAGRMGFCGGETQPSCRRGRFYTGVVAGSDVFGAAPVAAGRAIFATTVTPSWCDPVAILLLKNSWRRCCA